MEEKKSFLDKIKEHKTEIVIAGVTVVTIAGIVLVAKNWGVLKGSLLKTGMKAKDTVIPLVPETIKKTVIEIPTSVKTIDVCQHIRILPQGWKPSAEKLAAAIERGIELGTNQTWVGNYSKCA